MNPEADRLRRGALVALCVWVAGRKGLPGALRALSRLLLLSPGGFSFQEARAALRAPTPSVAVMRSWLSEMMWWHEEPRDEWVRETDRADSWWGGTRKTGVPSDVWGVWVFCKFLYQRFKRGDKYVGSVVGRLAWILAWSWGELPEEDPLPKIRDVRKAALALLAELDLDLEFELVDSDLLRAVRKNRDWCGRFLESN